MPKTERRAVAFRQAGPGVLEGVLVPYGVRAAIAGVFGETFQPGALRWSGSVLANVQHDRARPLARLGHGLALEDGADALRATVTLPETTEGRDTRALVEAGVLTGFSAEFRAVREEWPSETERIVHDAELLGLAVVDDPAHETALIAEIRAKLDAAAPKPRRRVWL